MTLRIHNSFERFQHKSAFGPLIEVLEKSSLYSKPPEAVIAPHSGISIS
ncbi:hypothetical protein [Lacihabitans soyangensis]|nr:hypothetical protein [Lacihabitans soyangensis]